MKVLRLRQNSPPGREASQALGVDRSEFGAGETESDMQSLFRPGVVGGGLELSPGVVGGPQLLEGLDLAGGFLAEMDGDGPEGID